MFLYTIRNKVSGRLYYGITVSPKHRWAQHKFYARTGSKTPLYDAMRSYGEEQFSMEVIEEGSAGHIAQREIDLIATNPESYNLHQGGHIGFDVRTKGADATEEWKAKLRTGRAGATPALGMQHTEETKKLCGEYGKLRWDIYGRYPVEDILALRCCDAMRKYGISKTHYYRLRKAAVK